MKPSGRVGSPSVMAAASVDPMVSLVSAGLVDMSSFWMPEYLCTSAWLAHAPFMFWLIGHHRPSDFVELGTHNGFSYLAACQAVERHATGTRCFAVDTWAGDEHSGFYGEEVLAELTAYHDRRYAQFSSLVRGTFDDSVEYFADGSIDLLHVDGRHFYDDVRHDVETWLPKMSSRGLMVLHDTNVRDRGFGIAQYLADHWRAGPRFEFTHGHGLAVLQVGTAIPEAVASLLALEATSPEAAAVQVVYARLGEAVEDAWRRGEAERAYAERSRNADELQAQLSERSVAVERLEAELTERSVAVARLEAALTQTALPTHRGLRHALRHPTTALAAARMAVRTRVDRRLLIAPLFDPSWYKETYPDVAESGVDPALHYLRVGARNGYDPSPGFSTSGYLANNPDVAESRMNPLVHYLRSGPAEGRTIPPSSRSSGGGGPVEHRPEADPPGSAA